jgi:hypothetical protein
MAAASDFLENKLVDWLLRGQSFTPPATVYVALLTAAPSDSGGGTEVTGGSYARVAVGSSLANWAGTQSAGSTTASSGTGGQTSNNSAIAFPTPTANWGTVTHFALYDAASAGNLLIQAALTTARTINTGEAKQRRRFTSAPTPIEGTILIRDPEVPILYAFWDVTLGKGALRFEWVHPRTRALATFRFTDRPELGAQAGGAWWRINLKLELLA